MPFDTSQDKKRRQQQQSPSINSMPNEGCYELKATKLAHANAKREEFTAASELTVSVSMANTAKINFVISKNSVCVALRGPDIADECYQAIK